MKVRELRAALAGLPDDVEVVMQVRLTGATYPINEYYEIEETDFDAPEGALFLMSVEGDI